MFGEVPMAISLTNKMVRRPADMKDLKIRAYGAYMDLLKKYGANPVSGIPPLEIYEGIQRGLIDGVAPFTVSSGYQMKVYEVAPYVTDMGWGVYCLAGLGISMKTWNKLPPDIQNIISELRARFYEMYLDAYTNQFRHNVTQMMKGGAKIFPLTPEREKEWLRPINVQQWQESNIKALASKGLPARELFSKYIEKVKAYEKISTIESAGDLFREAAAK